DPADSPGRSARASGRWVVIGRLQTNRQRTLDFRLSASRHRSALRLVASNDDSVRQALTPVHGIVAPTSGKGLDCGAPLWNGDSNSRASTQEPTLAATPLSRPGHLGGASYL